MQRAVTILCAIIPRPPLPRSHHLALVAFRGHAVFHERRHLGLAFCAGRKLRVGIAKWLFVGLGRAVGKILFLFHGVPGWVEVYPAAPADQEKSHGDDGAVTHCRSSSKWCSFSLPALSSPRSL